MSEGLDNPETLEVTVSTFVQTVRQGLDAMQSHIQSGTIGIHEVRRFMDKFDTLKNRLNLNDNAVRWPLSAILELRVGLMHETARLGSGNETEKLRLYHAFLRQLAVALKQVEKEIGEDVSDSPTGR